MNKSSKSEKKQQINSIALMKEVLPKSNELSEKKGVISHRNKSQFVKHAISYRGCDGDSGAQ